MRRVKHLQAINYISPLASVGTRVVTLSAQSNFNLRKVNTKPRAQIGVRLFAKFDSFDLDGFQIISGLSYGFRYLSSVPQLLNVYRISDGSWSATLIGSVPQIEAEPGLYESFVSLGFLGSNELSGAETYMAEVTFLKRNVTFQKRVYFNHLGCFDSINLLRKQIEYLELTKLDE